MQAGLFLALLTAIAAEPKGLIPYDQFHISVETNDWLNRTRGFDRFNVSVVVAKERDSEKSMTHVRVNCYSFPAGKRMLPESDIEAFYQASAAAVAGKRFRTEVQTKTLLSDEQTVYESLPEGDAFTVSVTRAGSVGKFMADEGEKLKNALASAQRGEAWFKKLLTADSLPEATDEARPPASKGFQVISSVGQVSGEGMAYEISLNASSFQGRPQYRMSHALRFELPGGNRASSGGSWVKELLDRVEEALAATDSNDPYDFESLPVNNGRKFSVFANPDTKKADIVLVPGKFFRDQTPREGTFGKDELEAIRKLIADYEERMLWFQQHENMFFDASGL